MPDDPQPNPDLVTITKADLATLQNAWKLQAELFDHPTHGLAIKKAMKDVRPTMRIPELDVLEPALTPLRERQEALDAENKKLREELEADRQARADAAATGDLVKNLSSAQSRYRLTDEGMAEVKKIMVERNIADPHAAAALVASEIEPPKVVNGTNFGPADLNVLGMDGKSEDASMKRLHEDPIRWQDQEISEIMAEFDQAAA
ncbi:MAG TPA: hypothetical protein VN663_22845 [Ramlibacter sp.]|nr:hypothetical protein [Ramlibacter sp.]